jgi:hypothetical protein
VGLHDNALRLQHGQPCALPGQLRGPGHIDGLLWLGDVGGLVAHGGKNFAAEALVAREAGHSQRLDQVALC